MMHGKYTKLLRTIYGDNGQLFYQKDGKRTLLAECELNIEILEDHYEKILTEGHITDYKKHRMQIAFGVHDYQNVECTPEFIGSVDAFNLSFDALDKEGVWQPMTLGCICPDSVDDFGEWRFSIDKTDTIKKFLNL